MPPSPTPPTFLRGLHHVFHHPPARHLAPPLAFWTTQSPRRSFTHSPRTRASEVGDELGIPNFPQLHPTLSLSSSSPTGEAGEFSEPRLVQIEIPFDKIAAHPELLEALVSLSDIVISKTGFDMRKGKMPSVMDMWKLQQALSDPDFLDAASKVKVQMEEAGIPLDDLGMMQALGDNLGGLEELFKNAAGRGEGDGEGEGEGEGDR